MVLNYNFIMIIASAISTYIDGHREKISRPKFCKYEFSDGKSLNINITVVG